MLFHFVSVFEAGVGVVAIAEVTVAEGDGGGNRFFNQGTNDPLSTFFASSSPMPPVFVVVYDVPSAAPSIASSSFARGPSYDFGGLV